MPPLVIIGPTASGKSSLAMSIASRISCEIVSVDSRQIYRGLDIGTAKPTAEDQELVPHHMIDLLELDERTDAKWFANLALEKLEEIRSRGRLPLIVGGSGLYLRALLEGFFEIELGGLEREEFAESVESIDTAELFESLEHDDPVSAARIHPNDRYRIIRALEVFRLTGTTLSDHFSAQRDKQGPAVLKDCIKLGIDLPRDDLRRRIIERTREMFDLGWPEETRALIDAGTDPSWYGMKTLGYPEVIDFVRGDSDREETIQNIATKTRQYAKRQMTWFRKEKGVNWLSDSRTGLLTQALKFLDSSGFNW